jgi:hypothetical protein
VGRISEGDFVSLPTSVNPHRNVDPRASHPHRPRRGGRKSQINGNDKVWRPQEPGKFAVAATRSLIPPFCKSHINGNDKKPFPSRKRQQSRRARRPVWRIVDKVQARSRDTKTKSGGQYVQSISMRKQRTKL